MNINIHCNYPSVLKKAIFSAITDGTLRSWKVVKDEDNEKVLTHKSGQYAEEVLIELNVNNENDLLQITTSYWDDKEEPNDAVIAIYLGMFTSTLLTHFGEDFDKLEIYP